MPTAPLYPHRAAVAVLRSHLAEAVALSCSTPTVLLWADSDPQEHWVRMLSPMGLLSSAFHQQVDRGAESAKLLTVGHPCSIWPEDLVTQAAGLFAVPWVPSLMV